MQYSLMQRILIVEIYIRNKLRENYRRKFRIIFRRLGNPPPEIKHVWDLKGGHFQHLTQHVVSCIIYAEM